MSTPAPLVPAPVPLTEDFDSSLLVSFAKQTLIGAAAGDGESYVMRWPALPSRYEPLAVEPGQVVQLAATATERVLVVLEIGGVLSAIVLDLAQGRRGELLNIGSKIGKAGADVTAVWSPDGAFVALGNVRIADAVSTIVWAIDAPGARRWILSGAATRWDSEGLVLLQQHGCSRFRPGSEPEFVGDAPPHRSADGRYEITVNPGGLEIRDRMGPTRTVATEALELAGWLGSARVVLGWEAPEVLDLVTLERQPLAPPGHVFRAASPGGRWVVLTRGETVLVGDTTNA